MTLCPNWVTDFGFIALAASTSHWLQGGLFFIKKYWKYCDGVSKYFTMFSQKKLQENNTYYPNISV